MNADIGQVDVILIPEVDNEVNPLGIKGVGELGIVGTASVLTDAIYNATGTRIRELRFASKTCSSSHRAHYAT